MNWILQGSPGVKEQPKGVRVHAHTRWVKSSPKDREERKWQAVFQSLSHSLPHCFKDVKTHFRWKLSSASPKYLLLQTKTRWNLVPQMFPKKQGSPGSYCCKSQITAGTRELKMYRGEEIHRIASVELSVTRCRLTDWMISKPVPVKLLIGVGVQELSQGFTFLLLTGAADIEQTPGNLEMSKHFLFLLCIHGGIFTVLLARICILKIFLNSSFFMGQLVFAPFPLWWGILMKLCRKVKALWLWSFRSWSMNVSPILDIQWGLPWGRQWRWPTS